MRVRHERPMANLSFNVTAPLRLTIANGKMLKVAHWSLNGVLLANSDDQLDDALLTIPFQGIDIQFRVKFKQDPETNELRFIDLTGRQRETLAVFYNSVLSGKMASTNDVITSLDAPVDLVPMEETETEAAFGKSKVPSRWLRIVWNVTAYLLLSIFVFGFVGNQIWKRLNNIHLEHGRFTAEMQTYVAPATSFVKEVLVTEGDAVQQGMVLVTFTDPMQDSRIDDIRAAILLVEQGLVLAEKQLAAQHPELAQKQLAAQTARREHYRKAYLGRFDTAVQTRRISDFFSNYDLADVNKAWLELKRFDANLVFNPGGYVGILNQLTATIEERTLELHQLTRELGHREFAQSAMNIVAKQNGVVSEVLITPGQYVRFGTESIILEADQNRVVVAWLDDRMADQIYVGMPASISYNSGRKVTSIPARIQSMRAGVGPAQPDRYGMLITVEPLGVNLQQSRVLFVPNMPAKIILDRKLLAGIWKGSAS